MNPKSLVTACLLCAVLAQSPVITFADAINRSNFDNELTSIAAEQEPNKESQKSPFEGALEKLEWRSIGPANMGGRVADVEGVPGDPNVVFVASASGGLWKTTNGGYTWKPIFERQGTISIGDIALQPGNPDVIWVGTGESNTRNSVSFGDGVYKSNDGGKT